jgi:hypothetical protein
MRQGQQNRRGRGRGGSNTNTNTNSSNNGNRKTHNPLSRTYESSGPDVKIRGTAAQIAEKYMTLSRDASSSSDTVMAENYLQHAEHYIRIIMAAQTANVQAAALAGEDAGQGPSHGVNGSQRPHREVNHNMRDQPQPHIPSHPGSEPQPLIAGAEKPESNPQPVEKADAPAVQQPSAETDGGAEEQNTADGNDPNEQPRRRRRRYPSATGNGSSRASANGNDDGAAERTAQGAIAETQSPGEATA